MALVQHAAPARSDRNAGAMAMPPSPRPSLGRLLAWGLLLAALGASWQGAEMRPIELVRDAGNMAQFARGFFPPDFGDWRQYLAEMVVTFEIALWGTALAV